MGIGVDVLSCLGVVPVYCFVCVGASDKYFVLDLLTFFFLSFLLVVFDVFISFPFNRPSNLSSLG